MNACASTSRHRRQGSSFSKELRELSELAEIESVTLRSVVSRTKGRECYLVLLLLSVPFITPIPLPGFSIPFGIAAALLGGQMVFVAQPWLPRRLLDFKMRPEDVKMVFGTTSKVARVLEHLLRARMCWLTEGDRFRRVAGGLIAISGLCLVLPLPLPFSNSLPALTILLVSAAALEQDGLCFLAGCGTFVLAGCYFIGLFLGGARLIDQWLTWMA